ncbi:hypothetical protein BKI52_34960 [marine bacterium AO1-C]|nr:hypothetical protein BKI52_34960 [marine bacterium AO1-C]
MEVLADSIKVDGALGSFTVQKKITQEKEGVQFVTFTFTSPKAAELLPVSLKFNFRSVDINGYWNPKIAVDKVNYYYSGFTAKASRNAPVLSFYNNALQNRITMALSDALNQSQFVSYLKEEDVYFYPEIKLFQKKLPKTTHYEIVLRLDTRDLPYYKAIAEVADWWATRLEYKPMTVPNAAKQPMYSTWYSYHQGITAREIVAECKIAKSLGCEAVIVDDGWQTNDGNRGYAYTGDWKPERIPDMKVFVEAVHQTGMKFLLWYSLPFMGEKAQNYERFKGKYLRHWASQKTYVLDPRYPEVRKYIVNTYIKSLQEWKVDGFKLDFIGWFTATKDTKLTKEGGRDYASVNKATDALMTEITTKLTALKPDILIEFRQPYIGPLMRKYGNMFRGVDAPNNAVANRIEITNLRIMAQNTAVHSDMFIWRPEEPVEIAALQLLNILYSVPQLSVKLKEIPARHLKMIKFWFNYWNTHRHILLDGQFIPSNPGANYPKLTAISQQHQITTLYEDMVVIPTKSIQQLDIINAKASNQVAVVISQKSKVVLKVIDCQGKSVVEKTVALAKGIHQLAVPPSGLVKLRFKSQP